MASLWIDQDLQSNRVIEAAEQQIRAAEGIKADLEPPWDGFCGLVRICDDEALKERGVIRASLQQHMAGPAGASQGLGSINAAACQARQGMPAAGATAQPLVDSIATAASAAPTASTVPVAHGHPAAGHTNTADQQPGVRQQQIEPASAPPSLDDQEQEGDIPMWVMDYVIAASTSSEGGSHGEGSKSDGSGSTVEAVLADLLGSDTGDSGDDHECGSTDDWVDDLPVPPTHTAVKPA